MFDVHNQAFYPLFRRHSVGVLMPTTLNTGAIREVTSGELLTKQAMKKIYIKNTYIFKLLFNVVADGIEALVSGNKFLYS
jgi:hypothetical protein